MFVLLHTEGVYTMTSIKDLKNANIAEKKVWQQFII